MKDWSRIQSVFIRVLEYKGGDRASFLQEICAGQDAVLEEVEALLHAHNDEQKLDIEQRLEEGDVTSGARPALRVVGSYRLEECIGQGGMGDVYRAYRDDDVFTSRVAVKLLRWGMQSPSVVSRFRLERKILGRLEHEHIARIIDGGESDEGQPYLVMEYVEGVPITTYCDTLRLSIPERLRLFLDVCDAVQYAHLNLVVHRDLKPSNILVTDAGHTKLLDFGIAKLIDAEELGMTAAVTRSDVRPMTPQYAAPEQVRGDPITTATDVYALGVILYELLAGCRPFQENMGQPIDFAETILRSDPIRPSEALGRPTKHEASAREAVGANRRSNIKALKRRIAGDLDTIVLKAMQKDVSRRYASVDTLAQDITFHLQGLPITARPDTLGYRVQKFVRRNTRSVVAASIIMALVVAFAVAMTFYTAKTARQNEAIALERDRAEQVSEMLIDLYRATDPGEESFNRPAALAMLEIGHQRVLELDKQPNLQVEFYDVLQKSYTNLDMFEEALAMAESSLVVAQTELGERHPSTIWATKRVADGLRLMGDVNGAILGHAKAVEQYRNRELGDDTEKAQALLDYAHLLGVVRRMDEAFEAGSEALEVAGELDDPAVEAEALQVLGVLYRKRGQPDDAIQFLQKAVETYKAAYHEEHIDVIRATALLARTYIEFERYGMAKQLLDGIFEKSVKRLGRGHSEVTRILRLLSMLHEREGNFEQMEALCRELLAIRLEVAEATHPIAGAAQTCLGHSLLLQQRYEEAERHLLNAYQIRASVNENMAGTVIQHLVTLYRETGQEELAWEFTQKQQAINARGR